jgi:UDP-GlcNAc:undecaprenyl-phosphate/decaprenyl-phosphate GlcNAc-1-phosphate transferase
MNGGISYIIFGFITAFFVVMLAIPSLIKVAKLKHLVDEPSEERKLHRSSVPTIGGIVIFGAIVFSYALWFPEEYQGIANAVRNFKYLIAVMVLLFFVGIKDDIIGTAPMKKLGAHVIVGFILVIMADVNIKSMYGLFGITSPFEIWQSYLLTLFVYVVIVNAINLIDGLDGLAGGIGMIVSAFFGRFILFKWQRAISSTRLCIVWCFIGVFIFQFPTCPYFYGRFWFANDRGYYKCFGYKCRKY